MTLEDNKAVIRRFVEALNTTDMALVATILAPPMWTTRRTRPTRSATNS